MTRIEGAGIAAAGLAVAAVFAAEPALAHHAMGGGTPRTALQGLLSGLAHPVIGVDHLAFVVGAGLLAGLAGRRVLPPLAFVAATLAGTALHLRGLDVPFAEPVIGGTVLVMALGVFVGRRLPATLLAALFAVAGLFHGYAYAENIIGAEPAPFYAYLLGFAAVQGAIATGCAAALDVLAGRRAAWEAPLLRLAGLAIAIIGVSGLWSALQAG